MKLAGWVGAALLAAAATQAGAVGRLADLSVYDRTEGRRLQVYWHEGRAWVVGKPGNEYQVSVRSHRGEDLLAVMSVDGVNVITGDTASPQQSGYILAPWQPLDVRGWRKNLERTAAFYFTELSDSYAARTGRPDNVGVIGVALFQRKRDQPPPQDIVPYSQRSAPYPADQAASGSLAERHAEAYREDRDSKIGTGHGPQRNLARTLRELRARFELARRNDCDLLRQLPQPRRARRDPLAALVRAVAGAAPVPGIRSRPPGVN
jgi:hypothetical protein